MKTVLSKENATNEFKDIVEMFNFTISEEEKKQLITTTVNDQDITISSGKTQTEAEYYIGKIMDGLIKLDREKEEIVYVLKKPVKVGDVVTKEIRFGELTRGMQLQMKIPLSEMNLMAMSDEKINTALMGMTSVSDEAVLVALPLSVFNDLRVIGQYFLS